MTNPWSFGNEPALRLVVEIPPLKTITSDRQPFEADAVPIQTHLPVPPPPGIAARDCHLVITRFVPPNHLAGEVETPVILSITMALGSPRHYEVLDPVLADLSARVCRQPDRVSAALLVSAVKTFESGARMGYQARHQEIAGAVEEGRVKLAVRRGQPTLQEAPPIGSLKPYVGEFHEIDWDSHARVTIRFQAGVVVGNYNGGHPIVKTTLEEPENRFVTHDEALRVAQAMIPEIYRREYPWAKTQANARPAAAVETVCGPRWAG